MLYVTSMAILISFSFMIGAYNMGAELNFSYTECLIMFVLGFIGNILSFVLIENLSRR
jgi:hypothetical protein